MIQREFRTKSRLSLKVGLLQKADRFPCYSAALLLILCKNNNSCYAPANAYLHCGHFLSVQSEPKVGGTSAYLPRF